MALLFADSCTVALTSFISPYRADRLLARELHKKRGIPFIEVYVQVPLAVAEARDPKGLYVKARKGEISDFTGVSAPYEEPEAAEVVVRNGDITVEEAVRQIVGVLEERGLWTRESGVEGVGSGTEEKVKEESEGRKEATSVIGGA